MSKDLNQIFDLDTLRQAWRDDRNLPKTDNTAVAAPTATAHAQLLQLLNRLEEAIEQEFAAEKKSALFRPTLMAIRTRLGNLPGEGAQESAKLAQSLDELEDLLDALSLPAAPR